MVASPARLFLVTTNLLVALALTACAPGSGLRETPDGAGPRVYIDWDAEPLPEVPFPNDLAARLDEESPTGIRVNFAEMAPTQTERDLRAKANRMTGFGLFAPIMVRFEAPLDLDAVLARHGADIDFADDAVYVIDVTPESPTYLQPALMDIGGGRFPIDLPDRGRFFTNDPRADESTLLFETVDEDLNGNGALDPGEDTDNDGVLDKPNVWPEGSDQVISWYERETDTLIVRPVVPLREKTTYAVILTERLVGLEGSPVRSPWEWVNHTRQTQALFPALDTLAGLDLTADDIGFAWTFTTAATTEDLVAVRNGLHGQGVFASLAEDYPASVEEALWLQNDELDRDPHRVPVGRLIGPLTSAGLLPGGDDSLIAQIYDTYGGDIVSGSFTTPYMLFDRDDAGYDDSDEWWRVEAATGLLEAQPQRVPFTCMTPLPSVDHQPPFDVVLVGHGQGGTRFHQAVLAWGFHRLGLAVCGFDFPGHGGALSPEDQATFGDLLEALGLLPIVESFADARLRDLNNDGFGDSGGDFWIADPFHTRDNVRQGSVDFSQFIRALRSCGEGTMVKRGPSGEALEDAVTCDWDGDGLADLGGPDASFTMFGVSLGGINVSVASSIAPEVSAAVAMIPGGGLGDGLLRSSLSGPREAVIGRILTPLIVGVPTDEGGLRIDQLLISVQEPVQVPIRTLPAVPAGGTLLVRNLTTGEESEGMIPQDGRFRVAIAADALSGREKRLLAGMPIEPTLGAERYVVPGNEGIGDALQIEVRDAGGAIVASIQTFDAEVEYEGLTMEAGSPLVALSPGQGMTRGTPRFRRLVQILSMASEAGDPIAYAPHWVQEPFPSLGPDPRNVLMMPTVGDDVVPIATGVALARAGGFVGISQVDERYGTTVDRWLVDREVVHGYEELGPYVGTDGSSVLFDVDDLDEGLDGTGAPSDAPLRSSVDTASGTSGLRIVYADPQGSHGWALPDPEADFDINTFGTMQAAWYLASRGQELLDDPCFETADCPFFRAPPE